MRALLDFSVPALVVFVAGIVIAIKLDMGHVGLALILGPSMFIADAIDGQHATTQTAIRNLALALVLFVLGFALAYFSGYSFTDFANQYSLPIIRLVPLGALTFASFALLQLVVALLKGQHQDDTDA